jgi:hypothetical protein
LTAPREVALPLNAPAQVEEANPPLSGDKLAKRKIDRLALRPRSDQALRLAEDIVIDVDVRPYTPDYTLTEV